MSVYLIDFENVRSEGLRGIDQLLPDDQVFIFYSNNADSLTFEAHDWIMQSKASIRKYKIVRGGKNALDFQLSTYLGYLLKEVGSGRFYIISHDRGFHYVLDFWSYLYKEHNALISCAYSIAEAKGGKRLPALVDKQRRTEEPEVSAAAPEAVQSEAAAVPEGIAEPVSEPEAAAAAEEPAAAEPVKAEPETTAKEPAAAQNSEAAADGSAAAAPSENETAETAELKEKLAPKKRTPRKRTPRKKQSENTAQGTESGEASQSQAGEATEQEQSRKPESALPEQEMAVPEAEPAAAETPVKPRRKRAVRKKNAETEVSEQNGMPAPVQQVKREAVLATTAPTVAPAAAEAAQVSSLLVDKIGTLIRNGDFTEPLDEAACASATAGFIVEADDKQDFYRRIVKLLGQKSGLEIYKVLRSEYNNLKQLV